MLAVFCTFLVVACGGGGGSAGTAINQPTQTPTATVSSLLIMTSSDTITSSGAPGSEVTVTVLARDSRNVAVPGATISLTADSGAIVFTAASGTSATPGVTDNDGKVTAKLNIAGVRTLRKISIFASTANNAVRSETKQVEVVKANSTVSIVPSSLELSSSGLITLTVLAKDGLNNVLSGVKINLTSTADTGSGGALIIKDLMTDSNGELKATLTAGNDPTERNITVRAVVDASAGGSDPGTVVIAVKRLVPKLSISASSGNLDSAGATGTEVNIVVLARDANNNVQPGVVVSLAATSGSLTNTTRTTSALGTITEKLSTGNDPTKRDILVTASAPGLESQTVIVTVSGTVVSLNASSSVNAGSMSDMTVTVADASGKPLGNKVVTFSAANGSVVALKNPAAGAVTDSGGNLVLTFTAARGIASDSVTVKSLGVMTTKTISINSSNFTVAPALQTDPNMVVQAEINKCYAVNIHNDIAGQGQSGTVSLGVSRGAVFKDAACTMEPNAGGFTLSGGNVVAFVKAPSPGVADLVATLNTGASTRGMIEFVAPLQATANVILQVDPGVIGVNTVDNSQRAVIKAVVRDGTAANNLVKGATINFSILQDGSGGVLLQPSVVKTGADGTATVTFIAGPTATSTDGVQFQGQVVSNFSILPATARLTVGRQALFITAGTGNTIDSTSPQNYIQRYQILVTDAAGNPVRNANVTASVLPTLYFKGFLAFATGASLWDYAIISAGPPPLLALAACANEDTNGNGILDGAGTLATEDINGNGRLEPGIPVTVNVDGPTDGAGAATVALQYARDQAKWLEVDLTIRASVSGSEAKYIARFVLRGAAEDYNKKEKAPPGQFSPYGTGYSTNAAGKLACQYPD